MQTSKISFRIVTLILAAALITACSKETRKTRLLAEADNYFKAGNYDKAKLSYLNVLRLDPANALAFERIGAMWQDDGAPLRAGAFLARAIVLDPSNVQNRIRLARCYVGTGQFADGKKESLNVLAQVPDNGDAIIALTEGARSKEDFEAAEEELQKFPKKNDISFYLASANLFFSKGDLAAASNALRQALNVDPKSSAAHLAMGNLHLFQKDQKQAGEEFKTAADLAPVRSVERLKYVEFKWHSGDADEVRRGVTEMTRQAPDYLPGWIWLAELGYKDKKYDEALSLLENVFGRDPEYIEGRRLQSDVLLAKGDTKKAVEVLERLDQTYPDVPLIKYQLARAYLQNNNTNQAKVALDQAVSINPNYDDAVLLLAQVNLSTGHPEPVIEPIATHPALHAILATCQDLFDRLTPPPVRPDSWHVEIHQFRIETRPGLEGRPTPEGMHRDGVDWVLVLLVSRVNVTSGETSIHGLTKEPLGSFTLTEPLDAAFTDDNRVYHGVTPVTPLDPKRPGHRDVLVVTFRRE